MSDKPYTQRGFRIFGERERSADEELYGEHGVVSAVESSLAFRGPHVRIYECGNGVQLNLTEAKLVRDWLALFIAEAEANELTEAP